MQPIINYIKHPFRLIDALVHHFGQWLPDSIYIKLRYRCHMKKKLNINCPQTFQEKLNWLKLHDHNPQYTMMVDKVSVKEYVKSKVGDKYIIPLIGVWDSPEEIDWDKLPNRFVLKTNHGGGNTGVVICSDKSNFDKQSAISKLRLSLKSDIYHSLREWPYKDIKKKVFAEEFIESKPDVSKLRFYRWFCFDGEPLFCQSTRENINNPQLEYFDINWNLQYFPELSTKTEELGDSILKPHNLEIQIQIARELSKNTSFSRIDLYELDPSSFFAEITFFSFETSNLGMSEYMSQMNTSTGDTRGSVIAKKDNKDSIVYQALDLIDYKFFCFDGEVKALFVAADRQTPGEELKFDFFDADYNHLPICQGHPNALTPPQKPVSFEEMKRIASKLSEGIPHVRVDFYEVNGQPYFGELTFCHFGAMVPFEPDEWDLKFGEWLDLNKVKKYD